MPTNLNALIRYKEINRCLRNQHIKCSIDTLIDKCSDALGEYRGVYKRVSERTIRDDIRVMRSDILGFNAPIVFEDGYYSYEEKDYSIFNLSISDFDILKEVLKMLIDERNNIKDREVDKVILNLANLTGSTLPEEVLSDIMVKSLKKIDEYTVYFNNNIESPLGEYLRAQDPNKSVDAYYSIDFTVDSNESHTMERISRPKIQLPWANILKLFK